MTDTTVATGTLRASVLKVALALGAVYVIWGSTYLAIRFAIETIPPFLMAATRYLAAGALLYTWARLRGAPRPKLIHWRSAFIVGAFLLLVGNGGVVWAEQKVDSGLAALLISTEPIWIVGLVWLRSGRQRPNLRVIAGMLLGFIGLVMLIRPSGSAAIDPMGAAVLVMASLSWAWGSLYGQRAPFPDSPLAATGMQMLGGGTLLAIVSTLTGEPARFTLSEVSLRSALSVGYLIVFGAIVAFTAYVWLMRVAPPVLVSTYAYVNPVVAVLLGWAFAGEPLTAGTLISAGVILAGVALISSSQGKSTPVEAKEEEPAPEPETEPVFEEMEAEACASR